MVSGIAKLFPVWAFEKQLVDLGIASWCYAPYLARFIIAFELSIGVAILQPHFLKLLVIPATILLLVAFCVHLSIQMYLHGAMSGNCGCLGQLIPMTPLEAFIKNIITIGLLVYLYFLIRYNEKRKNRFIYLLLIYLSFALAVFVCFPFCPCKSNTVESEQTAIISNVPDQPSSITDTNLSTPSVSTVKNNPKTDTLKKNDVATGNIEGGPKRTKSRYSQYTTFGNQKVNLDEGKKIICFFAAGCDHCRTTMKDLCSLSERINIPPVYIFFMDEETEQIPDFFKEGACSFPYTILNVPVFWDLLGMNADTPGVVLLWNGNVIKYYEGLEANKFNLADFESTCKSM